MKPFYIFIFILTLFIFGIVFYTTQSQNASSQKEALDIINQLSPTPAFFDPANPKGQQWPPGQPQGQQNQEQQLQQTLERIKQASITATIRTSKGNIEMELYGSDAPITIYNFAAKAQNNFYNNLTFHRVEDWVVQGGDPKGDGTGGSTNIPTELSSRPYVRGSIGAARMNDPKVQNDSQFFITKADASHLDGQYTNFGTVTSGMDVVDQIEIGDKILGVTVTIQ